MLTVPVRSNAMRDALRVKEYRGPVSIGLEWHWLSLDEPVSEALAVDCPRLYGRVQHRERAL